MVQELRRISFTKAETLAALEGYRRMTENFLPPGTITAFEMLSATSIKVAIQTDLPTPEVIILQEDKVAQPLIRFCLENNIPLPRSGRKSVTVTPEAVCLTVALDLDTHLADSPDRTLPPSLPS